MSYKIVKGDLFANFNEGCVLIHGCNAQHRMGAGVAAIVKQLYPIAYYEYLSTPQLNLGDVIYAQVDNKKIIANAITQDFYGYDGKAYASPDAILTCLEKIVARGGNDYHYIMPAIGCGLGGLEFEDLQRILDKVFGESEFNCTVYVL